MTGRRVLIVGDSRETHVGHHLLDAARTLGIAAQIADTSAAYRASNLRRRVLWHLAGHRPARLRPFGDEVVAAARAMQADTVIATGIAPLTAETLKTLGRLGIRRMNFLTDDPWNRAHRAPWFLSALPRYDHVWSPRHAVLHDLRRAGVRRVDYLAFGYNPAVHYPEIPDDETRARFDADVVLAGGADRDRIPWVAPLIGAGFRVALYGGYWHRYGVTRRRAGGVLDAQGLRFATTTARVSLGIVRRANRDGHAMRSYEVPAMGGCLLAERTSDHERLFGRDGDAVLYAATPAEAVTRVRWLLAHPDDRDRMVTTGRHLIAAGHHTYADRLAVMLEAS
ncbi:MAG: hypothetical protein ABS36_11225 [Acidobacteria bacterium SCN 69-37]|nr:MAG: hypothetical protein ABS36_11225 [Acidobacteria bacterium SCN 69-37]